MLRMLFLALALVAALPTLARAQDEAAPTTATEILKAILLPRVTQEAREVGVPEEDIRIVLEESRRRSIPADRTQEVLEETTEAVKENGPVDNFGAFVQARLAEGLRGRALAEAIHAEHRDHGKGKGHVGEKGKGHKGKPDHAGERHDPEDDDDEQAGKGRDKDKGNKKGGR